MVKSYFSKVRPKVERFVMRTRQKKETFLHSGILDSFTVSEEFKDFGDEQNHFRDFSLQSIIRAEAIDLLKPVGALPYDALRAADVLEVVTDSFDKLHSAFTDKVNEIKESAAQSSAPVDVEKK